MTMHGTVTTSRGNWAEPPREIKIVDGLTRTELDCLDRFVGTGAALVAAGLTQFSQLPGQPGRPKHSVSYRPAGGGRESGEPWFRVPGYVAIRRLKDDLFALHLTVSREEQIRRAPETHARRVHESQQVNYQQCQWGDLITAPKHKLQELGIGIGMKFPGEPGGPKRTLHTTDPRGFPVEICLDYSGPGFCARIRFPDRSGSPWSSKASWQEVAHGVKKRPYGTSAEEFVGTASALIAAGLARDGQFPGQPGMRKMRVTVLPDGTAPTNAGTTRGAAQPGAKWIERRGSTTYSVFVRLPREEEERRQEALRVELNQWEARVAALPVPQRLRPLSPMEVERRGRSIERARTDTGFQSMLARLTADKRLSLVREERQD